MTSRKKVSLFFKNYLAQIKKSLGTKMFQNYFLKVGDKEKDILENGRLSCAVFVSSLLILKGLIQGPPRSPHAIVKSLIKNLEDSGWYKIPQPRPGAVLVWEAAQIGSSSKITDHIGFYLGQNRAISNNLEARTPLEHHWTYGTKNGKPVRKVTAIYWHRKLW